ncbi:MAG: hypothetical protein QM755_17225 [Luteolibacter sp.]
MATPSTEPPRKSWSALVTMARSSQPLETDIRAGVRRAIGATPRFVEDTGLLADLTVLARSLWLRGTLAGAATAALVLGWNVVQSASDALLVMALHGELAF